MSQELWAASFARVFCWAQKQNQFQSRVAFMARLMDLCLEGLDKPIWSALRFPGSEEAVLFLAGACREYGKNDTPHHAGVFFQRCMSRLTRGVPNQSGVGAAWLFAHPESLITAIIPALDATGVANNADSKLVSRNPTYIGIIAELFQGLRRDTL